MLSDPRTRRRPREFADAVGPSSVLYALDQCEYAYGMYAADVVAASSRASLAVRTKADQAGVLAFAEAVAHLTWDGGEGAGGGEGAAGEAYAYVRELRKACKAHYARLAEERPELLAGAVEGRTFVEDVVLQPGKAVGEEARARKAILAKRAAAARAKDAPPPKEASPPPPVGERVRKTEMVAFTPARGEAAGEKPRLPRPRTREEDNAEARRRRRREETLKRHAWAVTTVAFAIVKAKARAFEL